MDGGWGNSVHMSKYSKEAEKGEKIKKMKTFCKEAN